MRTQEGRKRSRYARRYMDKYGKPTSPELAVSDQSKVLPETQAANLIDLVIGGADANELMNGAIDEIQEGDGGGPYHIGSTVNIGKSWSGPSVEGGSVSLKRGDVVSIVMPNLGEHGQDKMVLLSDGHTRAVVPLDILEGIDEGPMAGYAGMGGGTLSTGPTGHAIPARKGRPGGLIQQRAVGQSQPGDLPEKPGSRRSSSHPSNPVGQGKPKDHPQAQTAGKGAPTSHASVAVEAVFDMLDVMLESADDRTYRRISEFARLLHDSNSAGAFSETYEMLFGDQQHTVEDLEQLFGVDEDAGEMKSDDELGDMEPDERKKYLLKFRKKYRGKYMGMGDHAKKMMSKYGSNHAKKMAAKGG